MRAKKRELWLKPQPLVKFGSGKRIKVIATKKEEVLVPLGFQEGMFKVFDAKSTGMISDLVKKLNQLEPTDWTEATAIYTIRR